MVDSDGDGRKGWRVLEGRGRGVMKGGSDEGGSDEGGRVGRGSSDRSREGSDGGRREGSDGEGGKGVMEGGGKGMILGEGGGGRGLSCPWAFIIRLWGVVVVCGRVGVAAVPGHCLLWVLGCHLWALGHPAVGGWAIVHGLWVAVVVVGAGSSCTMGHCSWILGCGLWAAGLVCSTCGS